MLCHVRQATRGLKSCSGLGLANQTSSTQPQIQSEKSEGPIMKQTKEQIEMQAEEHRTTYRNSCSYRRRGNIIEEKNSSNDWVPYYTGAVMNEAKRISRKLMGKGDKVYVVR